MSRVVPQARGVDTLPPKIVYLLLCDRPPTERNPRNFPVAARSNVLEISFGILIRTSVAACEMEIGHARCALCVWG
jgi:hypothetical protein